MSSREYTLQGVIGSGGFGTVYRARMEAPGGFVRDVAIKLLHDKHLDEDTLSRFRDEARILGLLQDRAVVSVEPPTLLGGRWAVVMDYVEGASCLELLRTHGALPPRVAVEIIEEVARCLDKAIHQTGPNGQPLRLLHRDIKPANIQVTPAGEVRLLDFGVARAEFDAREAKSSWSLVTGTPGYIAPERMKGMEGPAGDVYSLGMVLWNLLTAKGPRERKSGPRSGWSPGADGPMKLAEDMLVMDPEDRLPASSVERRARELARELDGIGLREWASRIQPAELGTDELVGSSYSDTVTVAVPPPKRSKWPIYVGVVLGAVLLGSLLAVGTVALTGGAMGAWFALSGDADDPVSAEPEPTSTDPAEATPEPEKPRPVVEPTPSAEAPVPSKPVEEPTPQVEPAPAPEPEPEAEPQREPDSEPKPTLENTPPVEPAPPPASTAAVFQGLDERLSGAEISERIDGIDAVRENHTSAPALHHLMRTDPEQDVREHAFYVLVWQVDRGIGDKAVLANAMKDVLYDRVRFSQRKAAGAYGKVGTDYAPLSHVLKRGAPTARNEAIRATVAIAERTSTKAAAKAMLESASGRIKSKTQVRNLEQALADLSEE